MRRRAVFLDRDGVLNRAVVREGKPYPPATLDELEILPGVAHALRELRRAGFLNIVVTNQPDVATGRQRREVVDAINAQLLEKLTLDTIKVCYHADADDCSCRKPRPGMLVEASHELGISLPASCMVGDRWRDIEAGRTAGCGMLLYVDYGYAEKQPEKPYVSVKSLPEAVAFILQSG